MAWEVSDFATLMALEAHGPDVYVGVSPEYPWGRVYGGQVVAQGLRAAQATVGAHPHVPSLPASCIRGATLRISSRSTWKSEVMGRAQFPLCRTF